MKKIIMATFFILSFITMLMITLSIKELFTTLGFGLLDFEQILSLLEESTVKEVSFALGVVLWGLFEIYGIPLIVFLVSLHGLTSQ